VPDHTSLVARPAYKEVIELIARKGVAVLVGLAVCLSLAVVSTASAAPAPLVIAVEGPQSGAQAPNGLDQLRGVRLAVRHLEAHGGLWDGRKVVVYAADDKGDATNATAVARRVIARGIHFLIGPYNSSVGIANLGLYRQNHVLPLWMTSRDETAGFGVTVQPMNSQIAPNAARYLERIGSKHVAILVDDTANGAFTTGVAEHLRSALLSRGATVTWTSVQETTNPGLPSNYYSQQVDQALSTNPDLVYVSTYFPEGIEIAKALTAAGSNPRCVMGLANVDNAFLAATTLAQAQRCVFNGVPAATEMPSARKYVRKYRRMFHKQPGVWGSFTHDSARILFAAINKAESYRLGAVERQLRRTKKFRGATGAITINPKNGYRTNIPVRILRVNDQNRFVIAQ
jgi:branched-chain amino acid transport system substrate-binding protein